jgi:hypothetical protein
MEAATSRFSLGDIGFACCPAPWLDPQAARDSEMAKPNNARQAACRHSPVMDEYYSTARD